MKEENKVYAVIDTNVFVSALISSNSESNPNIILKALGSGVIIPLYNHAIMSENLEVLSRKQFRLTASQIHNFRNTLEKFGIKTDPTKVDDEIFPDMDDIVFYEVCMSVDDSYLVTGNLKHYPIKHFVVTPTQMVAILKEKNLI